MQHLHFKLIRFALVPTLLITVLKFQNLPCLLVVMFLLFGIDLH